jgi:hypothetical protein
MVAGTIYVVFVATDFFFPFQGFLITLGVPIAAWCGIFLADLSMRRRDYAAADLYRSEGRYGSVRWTSVGVLVVATVLGWGLVTNAYAGWLDWQGYLLSPLGLGELQPDGFWSGAWAYANLGVLLALVLGFVATLLLGRQAVREQESASEAPAAAEPARA